MKLLISVDWDKQHIADLQHEFPQVQFVSATKLADQLREAPEAEVIFGRISREVFLAARKLRWIQCQGAGVETLAAIPELVASDVVVTNTRGAHAQTIAESAFGMLLFLTRGFRALEAAYRQRIWLRPLGFQPVGLAGMTLGIIGLGNIGRAIAQRGHAFDMTVIAVDAEDVSRPEHVAQLWRLDGLPELLRRSDVVMIAAPYTLQSHHLIGAPQIALMKPGSYLLIVSRGGIVDDHAVAEALRAGHLAGAGLEVQEREPLPPDSELWDVPNLMLTPHCAGQSKRTTAMATAIFRENLRRYLASQPLTNLVDMRRGY